MIVIPVAEVLLREHAPEWCDDSDQARIVVDSAYAMRFLCHIYGLFCIPKTRFDAVEMKNRAHWGDGVLTVFQIKAFMREGQVE